MIRMHSIAIVSLCMASIGTGAATSSGQPATGVNRYIVQVAGSTDPLQFAQGAVQRMNGSLGHVYTRAVTGFSIQLPAGLAAQDLRRLPGVVRVEPDVQVRAVAQTIPTGIDRIDFDKHGTIKIDGVDDRLDVDIAIIDTGIDVDHPDLRVVGGRRFYTLSGRGYQDDRFDDDNGHGTHCAGIAAAIDNGIGVVGVAPGARLWAVKVLDSNGSGYLSDLIAGVDWVTAHAGTIEVANMSLMATARSDIFRQAIQNSVAAGVVHVAAAGNNGGDIFGRDGVFNTSDDAIPAAYPEVATISALADSDGKPGGLGASTSYGADDSFTSFSNYSASVAPGNPVNSPGAGIDLMMPGVNIYSCWKNGGYAVASGTSMASPHATGLVALYIAEHGRASNAAGVYAIRQALIDAGQNQASGMRLAHPETERDRYLENLGWAGQAGSGDGAPTAAFVYPTDGSTVVGTITIKVRASDSEDSADRLTVRVSIDGAAHTASYNSSSGYHELVWNTTATSNGQHGIAASATDSAGHTSSTVQIRVTVANSSGAPTAAIVYPQNGGVVSGVVTIQVEASAPNGGFVTVQVSIDGAAAQSAQYNSATGHYERAWDTRLVTNGSHTIDAKATDSGGHSTSAARITVTVSNVAAQPTMHVASVSVRIISLGSGWQRTRASVIVVDEMGWPVSQAVVTGTFSGEISEGAKMRMTDASGLAVFETISPASRPLRITFCVNNITHAGYKYQPDDNRESCDSTY